MANGPHIHDPSGHRYGKGDLPIADTIGKIKSAVIAGRDKKRKDIEKKNKDANKPQEKTPSEEAPKEPEAKPTGMFIAGPTLAKRPGAMPNATTRGAGGRMQSNPEYQPWKQANTDFKAHQTEQLIIQNHSNHQFQDYTTPKTPGKPMRATGYGPTNPRTGTINKARMGTIQKAAQNIETLSKHNQQLRANPARTQNSSQSPAA